MSDAPLNNEPLAQIAALPTRGMITLRGDLGSVDIKNAVTGISGVDFPGVRQINLVGDQGAAWMSPDEILIMMPFDQVASALNTLNSALAEVHHLAVDVSDARCVFRISGAGAREVIAKGAPVDMSPGGFQAGQIRRSRLGQVAAAFWMVDEQTIDLVCFRSVGEFVNEWLRNASASGGRVGFF